MKVILSISNQVGTNETVVDRKECVIGRENSTVVLEDAYCSRQHAVLYESFDGALRIRDNDSRNGVYVNGKRTLSACLKQGDTIRVGRTLIEIKRDLVVESEVVLIDLDRAIQ